MAIDASKLRHSRVRGRYSLCWRDVLEQSPAARLAVVDGIVVDAGWLSQAEARRRGLSPDLELTTTAA